MRDNFLVNDGGCWIWQGCKNNKGYGMVSRRGRGFSPQLAHRYMYEQHVGPIPDGMHLLHRCDTPACVNPTHMFIGTRSDNMRDMVAKGRQNPRSLVGLRGYKG